MKLIYHPKFVKQYKKLPQKVKEQLKKKGDLFVENPFDARLKTHKLQGKFSAFHAFWINYEYRVMFQFIEDGVEFYQVGTHSIYK